MVSLQKAVGVAREGYRKHVQNASVGRRKSSDGSFALTHVDEVIDELLTKDYTCNIALPRTMKRWTLKSLLGLEILPRESASGEDVEEHDQDRRQHVDENIMSLERNAAKKRM
ncbi:hypothetical protein M0R45_023340 [Rubus argutus]|uniref:Pre-mRNA-splicing factor 38 n=1 Tax=Rubus argutus TaxID=59490 RepID=A0AAW1WPH8_RUBAR